MNLFVMPTEVVEMVQTVLAVQAVPTIILLVTTNLQISMVAERAPILTDPNATVTKTAGVAEVLRFQAHPLAMATGQAGAVLVFLTAVLLVMGTPPYRAERPHFLTGLFATPMSPVLAQREVTEKTIAVMMVPAIVPGRIARREHLQETRKPGLGTPENVGTATAITERSIATKICRA